MLKLNKKSVKILSIVLLVVTLTMCFSPIVFADGIGDFDASPKTPDGKATSLANTILGTLTWVGIAIAIGMLIFLGIKYVTSSPDGKADLKKNLGVYVIGFVLIVAATTIVGILNTAITGSGL